METADLILFVVDAHDGLTATDQALAQKLRKAKPPVLLVLNKVDDPKHESRLLRLRPPRLSNPASSFPPSTAATSATSAMRSTRSSPRSSRKPKPSPRKRKPSASSSPSSASPNAGKSSLVNAILKDERTIVSEIAGTTRDAVDLPYSFQGENFTLIDTAGLRPRAKRDNSVEVFSAMRTEKAIRRADLCVLVIDLAAGITSMDRKIAQTILEEKKPCLIVFNKFDLYHPGANRTARLEEATEHVRKELFFLHYAPFVACSAKTGGSVDHVLKEALKIRKGAQNIPGTGQLNRILQAAFEDTPPPIDSKPQETPQALLRHRRHQREIQRHPGAHHRALRQRQAPHAPPATNPISPTATAPPTPPPASPSSSPSAPAPAASGNRDKKPQGH